ncbi:IPTL-CTERM sorting domain-containing protein [Delftia acidovorans]|uniref:IPTL-CTERM sorting domain-containing protein n=1 Tax=Delftia acidovorans TaxID=80866 RepID=UPI0030171514
MRKEILTLAAVLALAVPIISKAAPLTGYAAYSGAKAYSVLSSNLKYSDGTAYSSDPAPVLMICIDHSTQPPFDMQVSFESAAGASAIKAGSGNAGIAAIHWMIDNYFSVYYKSGVGQRQKAFQFALWEIGNDYDGTAGSISTTAGAVRVSSEAEYDGDPDFIAAYTTLYQAMVANLPALPSTYRSTTYTLDLFKNQDPAYQNMVAIIERAPPNAVPTAIPSLTGIPKVGSTITGNYTYADNDSDPENTSGTVYQFVTSPNPSIANSSAGTVVASGSTGGAGNGGATYLLQPSDLNKYIYFCVTPAAQTGATPGLEVCSVASGPVADTAPPPQAPTAIPGLGPWALMALTAILALLGMAGVRPRGD